MLNLQGKYTSAVIYEPFCLGEKVDTHALAQVQMLCDTACCEDSKIRVMPDVHAGKVGPVGLTMTVKGKIMPAIVSGDIGCGVTITEITNLKYFQQQDGQKLDKVIRERIPTGSANRTEPHPKAEEIDLSELRCADHIQMDRAYLGLGSLGGGNHFIEVERKARDYFAGPVFDVCICDEEFLSEEQMNAIRAQQDRCIPGDDFLVIHSGSRNLGQQVCDYYMKAGQKYLREKGIEVPYEMTWLEGELAADYLHDVQIVCRYAELNRRIMQMEIFKGMKWKAGESFSSVHNYIGEDGILRKGAVSAKAGDQIIIPANMAEGCFLGIGKGNPDWNMSAPHGTGRVLMRSEVKNHHTVSQYKKAMKRTRVYSTCIGEGTIDEAPFAYRKMEAISEVVEGTLEFAGVLLPRYNYKAGAE